MSIDHPEASRPLPNRPNLRHLKDQARDLLKTGAATSITDAQFKIARLYGFASWPKLKAYVNGITVRELAKVVRAGHLGAVRMMLKARPELITNAIEEFLRYDSSVQLTGRVALEDIDDLGGKKIPKGDSVLCLLPSVRLSGSSSQTRGDSAARVSGK